MAELSAGGRLRWLCTSSASTRPAASLTNRRSLPRGTTADRIFSRASSMLNIGSLPALARQNLIEARLPVPFPEDVLQLVLEDEALSRRDMRHLMALAAHGFVHAAPHELARIARVLDVERGRAVTGLALHGLAEVHLGGLAVPARLLEADA